MTRLMALMVAALIAGAPLAQGEGPSDETRTTLRFEILRQINRDRAALGLGAVVLDGELSALSDVYCRRQIRSGTTGHFTIDGLTPYMRYSFAGVNDGVSENAAAWSASYTFTDRALYDMARRSQEAMMAEKPPHDGHRKTILDPHATHVGIGLAWEKGEFRIVQNFVRRYITWTRPLPRAAGPGEPVSLAAKSIAGYRIEAISVHHEPIPEEMPPHVANAMSSYRLPDNRIDYLPRLRSYIRPRHDGTFNLVREEYRDGRRGDFTVSGDGNFNFTVPLREGPGVYTVVVWVTRKGETTPIGASNVSIRVDKPATKLAGIVVGTR